MRAEIGQSSLTGMEVSGVLSCYHLITFFRSSLTGSAFRNSHFRNRTECPRASRGSGCTGKRTWKSFTTRSNKILNSEGSELRSAASLSNCLQLYRIYRLLNRQVRLPDPTALFQCQPHRSSPSSCSEPSHLVRDCGTCYTADQGNLPGYHEQQRKR